MKKNEIVRNLEMSSKTFQERAKQYGATYDRGGHIMSAMFPDGIFLDTPENFSRFLHLAMVMTKMNRYATSLTEGGHQDSAHDAIVYSAMLEYFTDE